MNEDFWVYVNDPNNKALIHLADCSHCNHGEGREGIANPTNGRFHGPLSRDEAIRRARQSNKQIIRWCGFCAKTLNIDPTEGL